MKTFICVVAKCLPLDRPGSSVPDIFFTDNVRASLMGRVQDFAQARREIAEPPQWFEFPA